MAAIIVALLLLPLLFLACYTAAYWAVAGKDGCWAHWRAGLRGREDDIRCRQWGQGK